MLTQERLKELFRYNPDNGNFYRLKDTYRSKAGDIAGTNSRGYLVIFADSKLYFAHRLAWLYMTGKFPVNQIDHINCVKNDNRFINLRDVENRINTQNVRTARNCNKSTKLLGSTFDKKRGVYRAQIKINGKNISLGDYETKEQASEAYIKAKRIYHREGCTI